MEFDIHPLYRYTMEQPIAEMKNMKSFMIYISFSEIIALPDYATQKPCVATKNTEEHEIFQCVIKLNNSKKYVFYVKFH